MPLARDSCGAVCESYQENESLDAYLERKHQELELLASCLREPAAIERPESVVEVIKKRFASPRPLRPNTHCMAGHTPKPTSSRLPPRRASQVQLRLPACRPQCAWPFVLRRSV